MKEVLLLTLCLSQTCINLEVEKERIEMLKSQNYHSEFLLLHSIID